MGPFRFTIVAYALTLMLAGWSGTADAADAADADTLPSGLYEMQFEGGGRPTPRADVAGGDPVMLGKRLARQVRGTKLVSMRNDNSLFRLDAVAGPIAPGGEVGHHALIIAGLCLPISSTSDRRGDGTVEVGTIVAGAQSADKVAAELGITPTRRTHPGHRMMTTFAPEKPSFAPGEPVMLVMTITNVGTIPIRFGDGGSQRGPRNNQFGFTAFTYEKPIPDAGDPRHHGGLIGSVAIAPGKSWSKRVDISDWFKLPSGSGYAITGTYQMELHGDGGYGDTIWEDFAVASCRVRIAEPTPKTATTTTRRATTHPSESQSKQ